MNIGPSSKRSESKRSGGGGRSERKKKRSRSNGYEHHRLTQQLQKGLASLRETVGDLKQHLDNRLATLRESRQANSSGAADPSILAAPSFAEPELVPADQYQADQPVGSQLITPLPESDNTGESSTDKEVKSRSLSRFFQRPSLPTPSPYLIGLILLLLSGGYFFGIGRSRYQVVSEFIVRQPDMPASSGSSLLGPIAVGPTMMGSIEDGRFLAVYLSSPEVMRRVFLKLNPRETYAWRSPDPFAGLGNPASRLFRSGPEKEINFDKELAFFRRQVQVWPQELTGVIQLTTIGLDPDTAYRLNRFLKDEAEGFLNITNQDISRNQQQFAEREVAGSRQRLQKAQAALTNFQNRYGLIAPANEAQAASSYITSMESKLVDLKVQEATLKRQFKDPQSPEVVFVTDQIAELNRQIAKERSLQIAPKGKDVNKRLAEEQQLQNDVAFANTQLTAALQASTNSRQKSQMQLKFLITLSDPIIPEEEYRDWRWKGFLASAGVLVVVWGLGSFVLGVVNRQ